MRQIKVPPRHPPPCRQTIFSPTPLFRADSFPLVLRAVESHEKRKTMRPERTSYFQSQIQLGIFAFRHPWLPPFGARATRKTYECRTTSCSQPLCTRCRPALTATVAIDSLPFRKGILGGLAALPAHLRCEVALEISKPNFETYRCRCAAQPLRPIA